MSLRQSIRVGGRVGVCAFCLTGSVSLIVEATRHTSAELLAWSLMAGAAALFSTGVRVTVDLLGGKRVATHAARVALRIDE